MKLIVDGGSTKASWSAINKQQIECSFETEGYNPFFVSTQQIENSLTLQIPPHLDKKKVEEVVFYGAGCSLISKKEIVQKALLKVFDNAKITIEHDLLAAARALLGTSSGMAVILGTGTNSCLYDGTVITHNIDSLGYLIGDEGSGSYIGKQVLRDYLRETMPQELRATFFETYQLSKEDILNKLYQQPLANRFCASFSKFLHQHQSSYSSYTHPLIYRSFDAFFQQIVCNYPNYQQHQLNAVGSIAFHFQSILEQVAQKYQMKLGTVIQQPIVKLADYHLKH